MEQRDSCRQGSECRGLQIQGPEDSGTSDFSGIARWVHVGSFAPNSCTCASILAYACVVLLFTYSLSEYACFTIPSQPVI